MAQRIVRGLREPRQSGVGRTMLSQIARRLVDDRSRRAKYFDTSLFSDPAWDMLLDLFIMVEEGRTISVSDASIASGVPLTTGLRWVRRLCDAGLVVREPDERDTRRVHLRLSLEAYELMSAYLYETAPALDKQRA